MVSLNDKQEREHWQSLNAYAARLTRDESAILILFAKYSIEGMVEEVLELRLVDDGPRSILESRMVVAAEWVIQCGERLVAKEDEGLSIESWQRCKERFSSLLDNASMSPQTRERVQKAKQVMEALRLR